MQIQRVGLWLYSVLKQILIKHAMMWLYDIVEFKLFFYVFRFTIGTSCQYLDRRLIRCTPRCCGRQVCSDICDFLQFLNLSYDSGALCYRVSKLCPKYRYHYWKLSSQVNLNFIFVKSSPSINRERPQFFDCGTHLFTLQVTVFQGILESPGRASRWAVIKSRSDWSP
jgi:hypothetical protein